jgi:hypothetical protein
MAFIVEATDAAYSPVLMIIGFLLLASRLITMRAFILSPQTAKSLNIEGEYDKRFNGWFHPTVEHASFYVAILFSLAFIFSFRVMILNTISIALFPSILISVPGRDIPILLHPEKYGTHKGSLYWWGYWTIHIPMAIMGIWMFIMHEYLISPMAFVLATIIAIMIFLCLDNKENGVLDGKTYMKVGVIILFIWYVIVFTLLFPLWNLPVMADPMIAPVYQIRLG